MTTGRRPTIPPDELDDTVDEEPRRGTNPGRSPFAAPTLDEIRAAMGASAARDVAATEWGLEMKAIADSAKADGAAARAEGAILRERLEAVERRNAVLWKVVSGVLGVSGAGALLAVKIIYGAGGSNSEARARNAMIIDDHARLEALEKIAARNSTLLGLMFPNGVVRLYGPPVNPDLAPKDPPP